MMSPLTTMPTATPATEIERKFLVNFEAAEQASVGHNLELIEQTYLPRSGEWAIRSRKIGATNARYVLTMKRAIGKGENIEIEQEGSAATHLQFYIQSGAMLRKTRCTMPLSCGHKLELDFFLNETLQGLAIAEVELGHIDEAVHLPEWVVDEITGQPGYSNASLFERLRKTTTLSIQRGC